MPFAAPDLPGVVFPTVIIFNLQAGTWVVNNLYNDLPIQYEVVARRQDSYFSPDALAGAEADAIERPAVMSARAINSLMCGRARVRGSLR